MGSKGRGVMDMMRGCIGTPKAARTVGSGVTYLYPQIVVLPAPTFIEVPSSKQAGLEIEFEPEIWQSAIDQPLRLEFSMTSSSTGELSSSIEKVVELA